MALSTGDKVLLGAATLGFAGFAYSMRAETEEEKRFYATRRLNPRSDIWLVSGSNAKKRELAIEKIGAQYPRTKIHVGTFSRKQQDPKLWKNYMIGSLRSLMPESAGVIVLVLSHPPVYVTKIPELHWMNSDTGVVTHNAAVTSEDIMRGMERGTKRDNPAHAVARHCDLSWMPTHADFRRNPGEPLVDRWWATP